VVLPGLRLPLRGGGVFRGIQIRARTDRGLTAAATSGGGTLALLAKRF
jgi:hypothetical protein